MKQNHEQCPLHRKSASVANFVASIASHLTAHQYGVRWCQNVSVCFVQSHHSRMRLSQLGIVRMAMQKRFHHTTTKTKRSGQYTHTEQRIHLTYDSGCDRRVCKQSQQLFPIQWGTKKKTQNEKRGDETNTHSTRITSRTDRSQQGAQRTVCHNLNLSTLWETTNCLVTGRFSNNKHRMRWLHPIRFRILQYKICYYFQKRISELEMHSVRRSDKWNRDVKI